MEVRTIIIENLPEARCNPDKSAGPQSGQKVPFQDQASPTIIPGVLLVDRLDPTYLSILGHGSTAFSFHLPNGSHVILMMVFTVGSERRIVNCADR